MRLLKSLLDAFRRWRLRLFIAADVPMGESMWEECRDYFGYEPSQAEWEKWFTTKIDRMKLGLDI